MTWYLVPVQYSVQPASVPVPLKWYFAGIVLVLDFRAISNTTRSRLCSVMLHSGNYFLLRRSRSLRTVAVQYSTDELLKEALQSASE
jgi:hypothetical protein